MKYYYWIIRTGIGLAVLIALASCGPTPKVPPPQNHQIEVYLAGDRVVISDDDMVKNVKANDNLQWKVRPGIALKKIDIEFVDEKLPGQGLECDADVQGNPCQNALDPFKPVVTCVLKANLGPPKASDPPHDYCYAIHGQDSDDKAFKSLDPIVRGRRN